jgi:hypothetical protein
MSLVKPITAQVIAIIEKELVVAVEAARRSLNSGFDIVSAEYDALKAGLETAPTPVVKDAIQKEIDRIEASAKEEAQETTEAAIRVIYQGDAVRKAFGFRVRAPKAEVTAEPAQS